MVMINSGLFCAANRNGSPRSSNSSEPTSHSPDTSRLYCFTSVTSGFETFAQTNAVLDYDEDMLLPWLKLIYATGVSFRKKIRSK